MKEHVTIGDKLVFSVDEAADLLSIGRTKAFELISEGRLGSLKVGHRRLVPRQDLEAFVLANRESAL